MTAMEGLAAVEGAGTGSAGLAPPESTGETDFDALLQKVQFSEPANGSSDRMTHSPSASAGGDPDPGAHSAAEVRNVTVRAAEPSISERVGGKIETLNESRLLERGERAIPASPSAYSLTADAKAEGPVAALGKPETETDPFGAAIRNLQGAFHHAIEVEMVAKTGTSLNSSMNKLMSGQ